MKNKKIAMVIAQKDFRDEELFIPRSIFINRGAEVKLVSTKKEQAVGSYGGVVNIDLTLDGLKVKDFDAIVFVGGSGAQNYIDDKKCHKICQETIKKDKILGAICIAPAILAKSGVLKGKKATVWASNLDKSAVKILKEAGVDYLEEAVVIDGKIITANGPQSARRFGEEIVKMIT